MEITVLTNGREWNMEEQTLLRKLEALWGVPIFYTDGSGKDVKGVGIFSEKQNPLTASGELMQSLISRAKEQEIPVIHKVFGKIYFFCIQAGSCFFCLALCVWNR